MTRSVFVSKYLRVIAIAVAAVALLVPSSALASSGGGSSNPILKSAYSNGTTVTLSGSGFTPGGTVNIREYAIVPGVPGAVGQNSYFTATANGFHYVCGPGYCYRVYGDFTTQIPASPCTPYEVVYQAQDASSGLYTDWTYWQTLC